MRSTSTVRGCGMDFGRLRVRLAKTDEIAEVRRNGRRVVGSYGDLTVVVYYDERRNLVAVSQVLHVVASD